MKKNLLFIIISFLLNTIITVGQNNRKPLQIAEEFNLDINTTSTYFKHNKEGIIYTQTFSNKGSAYIRLHINSFDLKPGDYLKVYSKSGEEFIYSEKGKIIGNNKEMISEFWTEIIWSDTITVELHTSGVNNSHYGFNIDKVAYGHSQEKIDAAVKKLEDSSNERTVCSADDKEPVVCYDGTEMGRKSKAVCRLIINGGFLCTGWLLGCDGSVMTNNHCIGSAADANNTTFLFNYQYADCAKTMNATSDTQATSAAFVQTSTALDFTLVTLPVNPTPTYGYLSLSSIPVTNGERIYIPQHPGGRLKEIAVTSDVDPDPDGFARITSAGNGNNGSRVSYQADTEAGSSGSPVLRFQDHLVVAIHNTGGCTNGSKGRSDQLIAAIGANMPNCGVDDANPSAPFINTLSNSTIIANESSDCSYTDINLTVKIAKEATQNADVMLSVLGGTATNLIDYEIITPSVSFPVNTTANQNAILRIYNDSFVEGNETIQIGLTLNANGGDAQIGTDITFNITISDDDYAPNIGNYTPFFTNDFENGLTDFTVTGGPNTNFAIGNSAASTSTYFNTSANTTNFAFVNDDKCNCNQNSERLAITAPFDFTNVNEASITFDYVYGDENGSNADNTAFFQVSTDGGTTWTNIGPEFEIANWATKTIDLTAYAGQSNLRFAFHYSDLNLFSYGLGIDNIVLSGLGNATIQETVNTTNTTTTSLNSSGTVFTYDPTSKSLMTSITNNDNSNYGCLNIAVTRAGTSGQSYNGSTGAELAMDKSFFITATNAVSNGDNTITFYFTEAEIAGWEAAVANAGGSYTRTDLYILRDETSGAQSALPSTETSVATIGSFANHVTLTGTFTSVKGAYLFAPQSTVLSVSDFNTTNFGIFPNPVNNELTIKTANGKLPNSINVHNMLGQIIFKKSINSITDLKVNTSSLSNGMYFLSIQSDTANQTIKFVKK